ncbi:MULTISPECIES: FadR/GntR family transcriptional regulator [unclassified Sphingomonas]|uniref:FadR/GntR family transcriptional regulator n=1 Tax=unclassified Sphingomonas TaxID=196159 RepID=UPI0006F8E4A3|nr:MULTISPECIES: FadR/GntR family transcriptional regulator [unclassified Sphingomonas]KQM66277.1 GntR family transcriptional regulator [Sphingomonas sp. Leaf16]KQN08733.1 GntR family transcriptional regulator [Sphingomonas sp. Leaf29]KQN17313.1 GntR family transcriptional regulator [Sphingomonas sp. Leaf32]
MAVRKGGQPANVALARRIGVAIVTGKHEPGSGLPGEIDLAESFNVSRSVIRESLRMLAAKGLVESRPKAGTRVRERQAWNLLDPELLGWMFEGEPPPLAFVRSLFQLRMIVEPAAAELAAVSRSPRQLTRMGHALEEMARLGLDSEAGRAADQSFHATILEATGNELLVSLSASIAAAVRWTTFFKYRAGAPRDPVGEHQALFEAIARGDGAGARTATETLVELARQDTERAMALSAMTDNMSGK